MRWLVVSDLHYALRQFDWVCDVAPDFDLVVIAGDLLDLRSAVPIPAQSVAVSAQLARIGAAAYHRRLLGQPRPRRPRRGGGEVRRVAADGPRRRRARRRRQRARR